MEVKSENFLTCRGDPFGGVTVNRFIEKWVRVEKTSQPIDSKISLERDFDSKFPSIESAKKKLECSLDHWKLQKINGVWFEVELNHSFWVPILVDSGFVYHHAQPERVVLTKWLPENRMSTLPKYPFTNVGVGGVVENSNREILLMKERRGHYLGWKFPGGLADPNESLPQAAIREVLEETGVETQFVNILTFRHTTAGPYANTGDLYFVCHLKPKDPRKIEVKPCPNEAAAATWMTRDSISKLPANEIHEFHHKILRRLDHYKNSHRKGLYHEEFDPRRRGFKQLCGSLLLISALFACARKKRQTTASTPVTPQLAKKTNPKSFKKKSRVARKRRENDKANNSKRCNSKAGLMSDDLDLKSHGVNVHEKTRDEGKPKSAFVPSLICQNVPFRPDAPLLDSDFEIEKDKHVQGVDVSLHEPKPNDRQPVAADVLEKTQEPGGTPIKMCRGTIEENLTGNRAQRLVPCTPEKASSK